MVSENDGEIFRYIPKCNRELFESPANIEKLEKVILYKLRTMSIEDIKNLPDVNEGLENRIYESVKNSTSLQQLINSIKTTRYTTFKETSFYYIITSFSKTFTNEFF